MNFQFSIFKFILIGSLFFILQGHGSLVAGSREDAGQAGAFLNYAATARSLGMGRAFTAVADDAGASYWNPAGLSQVNRKEIVSLYSLLEEKTGYGFFSYAQPSIDYGTFGLSVVSLRSAGIEKRAASGEALGTFNFAETALLFSHGLRLNKIFAVGSTIKVVRQEIEAYSATGYGLDLSSLLTVHPKMRLGLTLNNLVAPSLKLRETSDKYPRQVRLGLQFLPMKNLMLATDFDKTDKRSMKINLGTEWSVNQVVALRAGLSESEITAGLGFKLGDWGLDYAIGHYQSSTAGESLGASHRFGFHVKFGSDISDQGESLRWVNKGKTCLDELQAKMENPDKSMSKETADLILVTMDVIEHRGFNRAQDLFAAQGYIHYFKGDYEKSTLSLSEAAVLVPANALLAKHADMARNKLSQEGVAKMITEEMVVMKRKFDSNDFRGAIKSCQKILTLKKGHIEALAFLEDAQKRLNEPIERALKIARAKFEQGEYLDTIKSLAEVRTLDPENKQAAQLMNSAIAALEKMAQATPAEPMVKERRVVEISPDAQKSRECYSQGLLLYSKGKIKEAVSLWKESMRYNTANLSAQRAYERASVEISEQE